MADEELKNLRNQLFEINLKQQLYISQYGKPSEIYEKLIKNLKKRMAIQIFSQKEAEAKGRSK